MLFHTGPITTYSVRGLSARRDFTLLGFFRPAHAAVGRRKVPRWAPEWPSINRSPANGRPLAVQKCFDATNYFTLRPAALNRSDTPSHWHCSTRRRRSGKATIELPRRDLPMTSSYDVTVIRLVVHNTQTNNWSPFSWRSTMRYKQTYVTLRFDGLFISSYRFGASLRLIWTIIPRIFTNRVLRNFHRPDHGVQRLLSKFQTKKWAKGQ